jgi:AraC family transcriptional regulator
MGISPFKTLARADRKYYKDEYICRINKVIDYLEHQPEKAEDQAALARLCYFSPRHFHRIFKSIVGVSIPEFAEKLRLEKAAQLLIHEPQASVTDIATSCGYEKITYFSKDFKSHFEASPSDWRKLMRANMRHQRKQTPGNSTDESQARQNPKIQLPEYARLPQLNSWSKSAVKPHDQFWVEEFESVPTYAIHHTGPYEDIEASHEKIQDLCRFLDSANLFHEEAPEFYRLYHHNTDLIQPENQTSSICLKTTRSYAPSDHFDHISIEPGLYAVGYFEIRTKDYIKAWNTLCGVWLPESGFQPDNRPCFELYPQNPCLNNGRTHPVKLCLPVKSL